MSTRKNGGTNEIKVDIYRNEREFVRERESSRNDVSNSKWFGKAKNEVNRREKAYGVVSNYFYTLCVFSFFLVISRKPGRFWTFSRDVEFRAEKTARVNEISFVLRIGIRQIIIAIEM